MALCLPGSVSLQGPRIYSDAAEGKSVFSCFVLVGGSCRVPMMTDFSSVSCQRNIDPGREHRVSDQSH